MGVYEDFHEYEKKEKHITYDMPTKQQINNLVARVLQNNIEKEQKECTFLFNQINKTLQYAVGSNTIISKEYTNSFTHTFNSGNIDIIKCHGFNEYNKQLLDRGIKYIYKPNSIGCKDGTFLGNVKYHPLEKKIYLSFIIL
jgi:hypothetical protein